MSAPTKYERAIGWPARLLDTQNMRVRLRREVRNGFLILPQGMVGIVDWSPRWDKLTFSADSCDCCKVRPRCGGLSRRDLEPIIESTPVEQAAV